MRCLVTGCISSFIDCREEWVRVLSCSGGEDEVEANTLCRRQDGVLTTKYSAAGHNDNVRCNRVILMVSSGNMNKQHQSDYHACSAGV